jgi:hypothetical protein
MGWQRGFRSKKEVREKSRDLEMTGYSLTLESWKQTETRN